MNKIEVEGKVRILKRSLIVGLVAVLAAVGVACSQADPTPTATPRPTSVAVPAAVPSLATTPTAAPIPTSEPTSTAVPTAIPSVSTTATVKPTTNVSTSKLVAQDGNTVTVHYRGTLDDGEEFDSSIGDDPLTFTLGEGRVIPGFGNAIRGLSVGDTVTVRIEPEDAYGEHSDDLVLEFERGTAPSDIAVGQILQLRNGLPAIIIEVTDEIVRIDANHRLAGQALTFEIEVMEIR